MYFTFIWFHGQLVLSQSKKIKNKNKKQAVAPSSHHGYFLGKESPLKCRKLIWEPIFPFPNLVSKSAIYPQAQQAQSGLHLHGWALGISTVGKSSEWLLPGLHRARETGYYNWTAIQESVQSTGNKIRKEEKNEWDMWEKLMCCFPSPWWEAGSM